MIKKTKEDHKIPEEKAMVSATALAKMKEEIRDHLINTEIEPLKQKLLIAIETVHQPTNNGLAITKFLPPTKDQVMSIIAPGCNDERMLSLFVETCKHLQLDPIKREIYLYKQDESTWIIKVDYKVPIAIAQRDTDYLHFKSWVEYDEKMKHEKTNPSGIKGAYCRIYKRSWVTLAHETGNPELAYKEHYILWNTWHRTKRDGNLFKTWKEKGHFYIEKTVIDHCFRLVYSELLGSLPPSAGYEIVEEEGQTIEARVIKNHKESEHQRQKPKIDDGFFTGQAETPSTEKSEVKFISDNEYGDMIALANEAGINPQRLFIHCKELHRISSLQKIPKKVLPKILDWINEQGEKGDLEK